MIESETSTRKVTKLFVYGTLRVEKNNRYSPYLKLQDVITGGKLFDLGSFPGAKFDLPGIIKGDILEVSEEDLKRLDCYEGFTNKNSPSARENLYFRKRVNVIDPRDNNNYECWAYEFNHEVDPKTEIKNGDWNEVW